MTACKWDSVIPFVPMWAQVKRLLAKRGAFVTTASQPFTSALIMSNLAWFKYEWIWEKSVCSNFPSARNQPMKAHESVLVFSAKGHTYNAQMTHDEANRERNITRRKGEDADGVRGQMKRIGGSYSKERYPRSVQKFKSPPRNNQFVSCYNLHPTQKPVALYEYLIRTYTNEGDTVLDCCMGSGTTMVACVKTGRSGIGIEKDAGYFAIAERRIQEAQAQGVLL